MMNMTMTRNMTAKLTASSHGTSSPRSMIASSTVIHAPSATTNATTATAPAPSPATREVVVHEDDSEEGGTGDENEAERP
jgi:hypothetical protein